MLDGVCRNPRPNQGRCHHNNKHAYHATPNISQDPPDSSKLSTTTTSALMSVEIGVCGFMCVCCVACVHLRVCWRQTKQVAGITMFDVFGLGCWPALFCFYCSHHSSQPSTPQAARIETKLITCHRFNHESNQHGHSWFSIGLRVLALV